MASIVATASIVMGFNCLPGRWQTLVYSKIITTVGLAEPSLIELPAHPIGNALAAVVGQGKLGFLHQVIVAADYDNSGLAGIAKG